MFTLSFVLYFEGKILHDEMLLSHFDIKHGVTVRMNFRFLGGVKDEKARDLRVSRRSRDGSKMLVNSPIEEAEKLMGAGDQDQKIDILLNKLKCRIGRTAEELMTENTKNFWTPMR